MIYVTTEATVESETGDLKYPRICYSTNTRDLTALSVAVSTEAADGPRDAPLRSETYSYWTPTAVPATWRLDMGSAKVMEYVAIAAHNLGTVGATIQAHYSTNDSGWTLLSNAAVPTDDAPIILVFPRQTARYVRLTVSNAIAKLGVVYVGQVLTMEMGVSGGYTPINLDRETNLTHQMSRSGEFLGQAFRRHGLKGSVSFKGLGIAWYRTYFDPFVKSARRFPYFFAWKPDAFPQDVGYVWTPKDIKPSYMGLDPYFTVSWEMIGKGDGA